MKKIIYLAKLFWDDCVKVITVDMENTLANMKTALASFLSLFLWASLSAAETESKEIRISEGLSGSVVSVMAQPPKGAGVAVSPAHIHLSVAPGESKSTKVTINNDTDRPYDFSINLQDFNMDLNGKSEFVPRGTGSNGLSRYMSVTPSFVELAAGEKKDVTVTIRIPKDDPAANRANWAIIMIEQAVERGKLDQGGAGNQMSFGIYPSFAFGVYIYQNPPNATINAVEIMDFKIVSRPDKNFIQLDVENRGDGISSCQTRVELVNTKTGESTKLPLKNFTIVPGLRREFKFIVPPDLPEAVYNAIGVVDYGSTEEILTAELEFEY